MGSEINVLQSVAEISVFTYVYYRYKHIHRYQNNSIDHYMISWDVGGRDKIRALYRHYYQGIDGLIFVVDSTDRARFDIAKNELRRMLTEEQLQGMPVLIFCNKQDLPTAKSVSEITHKLGLNSVRNRPWYIQPCCAKTGDGLFEGLEWLSTELTREKTKVEAAPTSTFKVDPKKQRPKRTEKASTVSADNSQSIISKFFRLIL